MAYDVRAIANFVLDLAASRGELLSNMQINKVVYFLHADYLAKFGRPLVSAKIEAWEHGPVFREIYQAFKGFGDRPVESRATKIDVETGTYVKATANVDPVTAHFLDDVSSKYTCLTASAIRALSHISGGPWDRVWNHESHSHATMRISDESILDWYRSAKH